MKKLSSQLHTIVLPPPAAATTTTNGSDHDHDHDHDHDYVAPHEVDATTRESLTQTLHTHMLNYSPGHTWYSDVWKFCSPHPAVVTEKHIQQLENLSEALSLAINDIVERWWSDTEARFPERMPLEPVEEELLRWIYSQPPDVVRPFRTCSGSWRPDMLLEPPGDEGGIENYRICEINARFCWNGYMYTTFGQQALLDMGVGKNGLEGIAVPEDITNGLNSLYNSDLPLHLCKGEELGYDIHLYCHYAESKLGIKPRFVHPADLRLAESPQSPRGYKLYCLSKEDGAHTVTNEAGEKLEEIHQIGLELKQRELLAMSFETLIQVSMRCFNDVRTILLVHDKRMLGIILQEIDALVARKTLTPAQATLLDRGFVPTIIPGSPQLDTFLIQSRELPSIKDRYMLKPVRSGKGAGFLFGDELSQDEWISKLERMRAQPRFSADATTYAVQRRIEHNLYEVLLHEKEGVQKLPFVGTFHMMHGRLLGLGLWRSSSGRICALSRGGAWILSVRRS